MTQSRQPAPSSETQDDELVIGHPLAINCREIIATQETEIEKYRARVLTLRDEQCEVRARISGCGQSGDFTDLLTLRTRDEELEAEMNRFAAIIDRTEYNLRSVRQDLATLEKFEKRR